MTPTEMMAKILANRRESARRESARTMDMLVQLVGGFGRGGPCGNGGDGGGARGHERPCSYPDFLGTHPPTFTPTAEPLDAEHWLRIIEQKFELLNVTDEQKVYFAAQQLQGAATAWWATFKAMQPANHQVTWREFTTAFHQFYIPVGLLARKLKEFLDLRQGNMTMLEYVNRFNHLSQYVGTHVDTDDKKRDCFYRGLSYALQEKLYTGGYQTFGAMMNAAIALEGLGRDAQAEEKRKRVATGPSGHPHT